MQELSQQKKEAFPEAKGEGLDVKILKEIIKLRKQDEEERDCPSSNALRQLMALLSGGSSSPVGLS